MDKLAKIRTGQEGIFSINLNRITQLSFYYTWDSILANIPIKETFRKIKRVEHMTRLVNLTRHDASLNDNIRKKIDIELMAETLGYIKITYDKNT